MVDLLGEGKSLEETERAIAAKAAKGAIESFAKPSFSRTSAAKGAEGGGRGLRREGVRTKTGP